MMPQIPLADDSYYPTYADMDRYYATQKLNPALLNEPNRNSNIYYNDGKRVFKADMNSSALAGAACGMLAGAALGIYLYRRYCEN